jgi:ribonucleoside-diphosphate reductase alpha chain
MLCIKGATWESDKHIEVADKVFEDIAYFAIKASNELAMEKGNYQVYEGSDWNTGAYFDLRNYTSERWTELKKSVMMNGMRNSYLMAVAPNGSSAIYGGGETQSIDPVYDKFYLDEKKNSIVPMFAPEISKYFWLYKEAHLMDQKWSIKANGARQKHIDQAQSFNLYITPETTSAEIAKLYMLAWTEGMKTIYYTRSRSVEVEDCLSCSV